jgi:hypothetical protein
MKFKKILSLLCVVFGFVNLYSNDVSNKGYQGVHQEILSEYSKIKSSLKSYDHMILQDLFKKAAEVDVKYLKRLEKDIYQLKKTIKAKKKHKEITDKELNLLKDLQQLHNFLKKYRLQMDIVAFHSMVKKDWGDLMQVVDKGEDILPILPSKGITKDGVKGLKEFSNKMSKMLRTVEEYETRLHADWIDLKLINYVLKIELIRLRNAAIFHPLYRGMPIVTNYPR